MATSKMSKFARIMRLVSIIMSLTLTDIAKVEEFLAEGGEISGKAAKDAKATFASEPMIF